MRGLAMAVAATLALGGCNGSEPKEGSSAGEAGVRASERVDRIVGRQIFQQSLQRVPRSPAVEEPEARGANDVLFAKFVGLLKAATTVNIDAEGLAPVAADAMPRGDERPQGDSAIASGLFVAASEPGATFSFDGYRPLPIGGGPVRGWHLAANGLAPGVHAIKVEKPGFFPVETQVLVWPGVYEVVAVRLGRVVMKGDGGAAPAPGGIRKP